MKSNYIVYVLFHKDLPDIIRYVGLTTKTAEIRLRGHWKSARLGRKYPIYFWMRKHGEENIQVRVLREYLTREEMIQGEIYWIKHFRSLGQADLNITDGGEGTTGWKMTDEQKEARRQYMLNNPIQYEITPEHRKAVGDANRARLSTPEAKREHANKVSTYGEEVAQAIKNDIWAGMNDREVREKYGVSLQQANNIRHEKSWTHLPWPIGPKKPVKKPEPTRGSKSGTAKLSEADVVQIRRLVRTESYNAVGELFGVSGSTVNNIVRGKIWTHVPFEDGFPAIKGDRDLGIQRNKVSGENSKMSKITDDDVRYIRAQVREGVGYAALGRELGVSDTTVANVVKGRTWKHVK